MHQYLVQCLTHGNGQEMTAGGRDGIQESNNGNTFTGGPFLFILSLLYNKTTLEILSWLVRDNSSLESRVYSFAP